MKKDNLGRKIYATKIAEEIAEHYDLEKSAFLAGTKKERENIIFAISGKWGEGKTDLLNRLEPILKKKGFKVVWFNPWQYSQEDISLKRAFLRAVKDKLGSLVSLDDLYYDRTITTLNFDWKFVIKGVMFGSFIYFVIAPALLGLSILDWLTITNNFLETLLNIPLIKIFITLLLIPVALQILAIKRRGANVSTAEEFEQKFGELLKGIEKLIIFVDDLDRCTPDTVKVILDSLKTFFRHPECAYIITGDHTVIERYAGEEMDKKQEFPPLKRLQEGRRFLKKIFDVYWRLPLTTPRQFGNFVDDEIKASKFTFSGLSHSSNLKSFLIDDGLFERNPRHVKRFLTKLRFALEGVSLQKKEAERLKGEDKATNDSKDVLEDILANPDLLAKVLLIEEFFYPVYEKLILYPEELVIHEKNLRGGVTQNELKISTKSVLSILDEKEKDTEYLEKYAFLVNKSPKFTDEENSTLHEVANYFSFSGSTGLPSLLGPDESNFEQYLKGGQLADKLGAILAVAKKEKKVNFSSKALDLFDKSTELTEKLNIIKESLKLSSKLDEWADKLPDWKKKLFTLPEEQQNILAGDFWTAVLYKSPALLSDIKNEKPAYIELLWPILDSVDEKTLHQDAKVNLENFLKEFIEPSSLNLKGVKIYLDRFGSKNLEKEIKTKLVDPVACRTYFEHLQKINASESIIAKIVLEKLRSFIENFNHVDWSTSNSDFLKLVNLFDDVKSKATLWSKNQKQLIKVASLRDALELTDKEKNGIKNQVIELTSKSADLQFLEDGNVQTILDKESLVKIFGKLKNTFVDVNESLEKRKKSAALLNKNNSLWNSLELNDIYKFLKEIKKMKLGKIVDLKDKPKEILVSWAYNEFVKEDEKKII